MVHRSMRFGYRVAGEMYIMRGNDTIGGFCLYSLHSYSCIAKQVTMFKQL